MPDSPASRPSVQEDPAHGAAPPPPPAHNPRAEPRSVTMGIKQHLYNPAPPVYDYEQRYPPDAPYHEIDHDARVWHVYNDEAAVFDKEMIEEAGDSLDILLIFAALFSGVVTTLVVETSGRLDTDYAEVSTNLLQEMVALQRAGDNATARNAIPTAELTTPPTNADVWVNGLWFTSLTLSLSTALLAVLAKQWLRQYSSVVTGSARDRAFVRHFRWEGFEVWYVQATIGMLPTVLHTSLGLFLAGLVVLLYSLNTVLARTIFGLSAVLGGVYLASTILPIVVIKCPYKTQFSSLLYWFIWQSIAKTAGCCRLFCRTLFNLCTRVGLSNGFPAFYTLLQKVHRRLSSVTHKTWDGSHKSAKKAERSTAIGDWQLIPERAPELTAWLARNTSSFSAKKIAFMSCGPCNMDRICTSESDRRVLLDPGLNWSFVMNDILSDFHARQDSTEMEEIRRGICSFLSFRRPKKVKFHLEGLKLSLPSLELAFLIMGLAIDHEPDSIIIKTPNDEYVSPGGGVRDVRRTLLDLYDPSAPPLLPQHVWTLLQDRNCLPNIDDEDDPVWKKILTEVLTHRNDYLHKGIFPSSHQLPISLAHFYARMIEKKGWLERAEEQRLAEGTHIPTSSTQNGGTDCSNGLADARSEDNGDREQVTNGEVVRLIGSAAHVYSQHE